MAVRIRAGMLLTGCMDGDVALWLDDVADDSAELAYNWSMSWTNQFLPCGSFGLVHINAQSPANSTVVLPTKLRSHLRTDMCRIWIGLYC